MLLVLKKIVEFLSSYSHYKKANNFNFGNEDKINNTT